jgi:hypothetical protein
VTSGGQQGGQADSEAGGLGSQFGRGAGFPAYAQTPR